MSSVLRIALTYFHMLSLQRWLNLAGLLLFAIAVAVTILGGGAGNAKTVFTLCTFGVTLVLLVPGLGGGMAMRLASRPGVVHLRPEGRLRLLLGSTLAMSLLALIACLPTLAALAYLGIHQLGDSNRFGEPLEVLGFFWPVTAFGWIIMFAASRTMWLALAFPVVPLAAMQLPFLLQRFPAFRPVHLVVLGALAWAAFALWYLRAARFESRRSPGPAQLASGMQFHWLLGHKDERTADSPAKAMACYLLGSSSYRVFAITGIWTALIFIAVSFATPRARPGQSHLLLFMLPFLSVQCAVMGFSTARRARLLWLRNGMDRKGLFAQAEKLGLRAAMITWGLVTGAAATFMIVAEPANASMVLLFVAAQGLFATCVFYVGMALVRNWGASDVTLCVSAILLLIVQMTFAHPLGGVPQQQPLITLLAAGALLLPLRWYTQRRWVGLDWRLIQPPRLDWRRG